jgi:hypothetical protein
MKKIGITSTGVIIVEMTSEEFDSLELAIVQKKKDEKATPSTKTMTIKEIADYAAPRLVKLQTKKKEGVFSSIKAMFQFSGGIEDGKIEQVFTELVRMRIFQENDGKIKYTRA